MVGNIEKLAIEIIPSFSMSRFDELKAFIARNYRADHPLLSPRYFKWQFLPFHQEGEANLISAWDGAKLVGIHGYIPAPLFWAKPQEPMTGAWAVNWYVEKEYRHGLGWMLMRRLQEMYPVILGLSATEDNKKIATRLGWTFFDGLPRYLRVFDFDEAMHLQSPSARAQELESLVFSTREGGSPLLRSITDQSTEYHPRWELYPALHYGVIRSLEYLTWRFFQHPVFPYSVKTFGQPQRPAICVYRIENTTGEYHVRVGRIVDYFHPGDEEGEHDAQALLQGVCELLREEGCVYADFICSNEIIGRTLKKAGWGIEPIDRQLLPVRLSPIERKHRRQNFEFTVKDGLRRPQVEEIYVTRSDADEDRPVVVTQ